MSGSKIAAQALLAALTKLEYRHGILQQQYLELQEEKNDLAAKNESLLLLLQSNVDVDDPKKKKASTTRYHKKKIKKKIKNKIKNKESNTDTVKNSIQTTPLCPRSANKPPLPPKKQKKPIDGSINKSATLAVMFKGQVKQPLQSKENRTVSSPIRPIQVKPKPITKAIPSTPPQKKSRVQRVHGSFKPRQRRESSQGKVDLQNFKTFVQEKPFDRNGILYYLATHKTGKNGKLRKYRNPHNSGDVECIPSSVFSGNGSAAGRFVEHCHKRKIRNCTNDTCNSNFKIDFKSKKVKIDSYCLRSDKNGSYGTMRNWKIEGSNDNKTWVLLRKHVNDKTMLQKSMSVGTWTIDKNVSQESFRYIRIFQHGRNSGNHEQLCCAGIEMYGVLYD